MVQSALSGNPRTLSNSGGLSGTPSQSTVQLEYVGRTSLITIGPVTGRRYYFGTPGVRLWVDARDHTSLASVPHLRRVRS